jgi:O-antigen/teichoic acid export membrane protein
MTGRDSVTLDVARAWMRRVKEHALARVGKNALALLVAQAGARLLNLLLVAQLARRLGAAALGRTLLAMAVEAITLAVADLGLSVYVVREFAALPAGRASTDRAREMERLWGATLALKLAAAACGILVLNVLVAPVFFPGERRVLIGIVSLALLPDAFNGAATALIKARQKMEICSGINLSTRLAATVAGMVLLSYGSDERALLLAYGAASLLGSFAFMGVLSRPSADALSAGAPSALTGFPPAGRTRVPWTQLWATWRTVLREALPFAITGIVAMLYTRIDLLMLAYWQGDRAAGVYGAAYRLWEALGMIPASLLDALLPELSRIGTDPANRARLRTLYRRGRALLWFLVLLVAVPCLLLAPRMMALLYGQNADTAVTSALFRALLLAFPFAYLYLLNGHVLYAAGRQVWVTGAMVAATATNGLLNALAIPRWSYRGAAGVAIFSQILLYALLRALAGRHVLHAEMGTTETGKESP